MSHIGKKLITIPLTVKTIFNNHILQISGEYGQCSEKILKNIDLIINTTSIEIIPLDKTIKTKAYFGLIRTLVNNMVIGVSSKFKKVLILDGIGFKCYKENLELVLNVGFSHLIKIPIPTDIEVLLESPTKIIISGINKQKVGLFASLIRSKKKPEPYKGKGILYDKEKIIKKVGKKGK